MDNSTIEDYLRLCWDGEIQFSLAELSCLTGISRMQLRQMMALASVPGPKKPGSC